MPSLAGVYLSGRPRRGRTQIVQVLKRGFDVIHFHNPSLLGAPAVLEMGDALKLYTAHEQWLLCPGHTLLRSGGRVCEDPPCATCELVHKRPPQPWRHTGRLARGLEHVDYLIAPSRTQAHLHRGLTVPIEVIEHFVPDPGERTAAPTQARRISSTSGGRAGEGRGEPDRLVQAIGAADLVIAGDGGRDAGCAGGRAERHTSASKAGWARIASTRSTAARWPWWCPRSGTSHVRPRDRGGLRPGCAGGGQPARRAGRAGGRDRGRLAYRGERELEKRSLAWRRPGTAGGAGGGRGLHISSGSPRAPPGALPRADRPGRGVILTYHAIEEGPRPLFIAPGLFRRHVEGDRGVAGHRRDPRRRARGRPARALGGAHLRRRVRERGAPRRAGASDAGFACHDLLRGEPGRHRQPLARPAGVGALPALGDRRGSPSWPPPAGRSAPTGWSTLRWMRPGCWSERWSSPAPSSSARPALPSTGSPTPTAPVAAAISWRPPTAGRWRRATSVANADSSAHALPRVDAHYLRPPSSSLVRSLEVMAISPCDARSAGYKVESMSRVAGADVPRQGELSAADHYEHIRGRYDAVTVGGHRRRARMNATIELSVQDPARCWTSESAPGSSFPH